MKMLRRNGGDCGYMVILQVDDIARTSSKLASLGGRHVVAGGTVVQADVGKVCLCLP